MKKPATSDEDGGVAFDSDALFSSWVRAEMELHTANETAVRLERELDSLNHLCGHLLVAPGLTQGGLEHFERLSASSIAAEVQRIEEATNCDGQSESRSEDRHRSLPVTLLGKSDVKSQIHAPPAHDDHIAIVLVDAERHEFRRTTHRLSCSLCHISLL